MGRANQIKSSSTEWKNKRTHEKNSGDAVRQMGSIIQSIFCAQSGASIRLTVWKWSGEVRTHGGSDGSWQQKRHSCWMLEIPSRTVRFGQTLSMSFSGSRASLCSIRRLSPAGRQRFIKRLRVRFQPIWIVQMMQPHGLNFKVLTSKYR